MYALAIIRLVEVICQEGLSGNCAWNRKPKGWAKMCIL